ncbi:FtsX-like permease family protein, partial [Bacillus sp. WP8]|uniref:FtsX-like permease family protein n=1 Tax=Bacillus sp. WP8 TaxID=756828 RepID=UPI0028CB680B
MCLVVGGMGVMNIMVVCVRERRREMGIGKGMGGRRGEMVVEFLIECVVLRVMGGLMGIG